MPCLRACVRVQALWLLPASGQCTLRAVVTVTAEVLASLPFVWKSLIEFQDSCGSLTQASHRGCLGMESVDGRPVSPFCLPFKHNENKKIYEIKIFRKTKPSEECPL